MRRVSPSSLDLLFLLFIVVACSGCPSQRWSASDATGNLVGDSSRTFMDIVNVTLEKDGSSYVFTATTATNLPSPAEMTGGKRVDFIWFIDSDQDATTGQKTDGNEYNIHAWLDEDGWHPDWYKVTDASAQDGIDIDFNSLHISVSGNVVTLEFPKNYLPSEHFDWWLVSDTINAVDWTPHTYNPPTQRMST